MLARVLCQAKAQGSIAEVEGGLECPLCMEVIVRAVGGDGIGPLHRSVGLQVRFLR